MKKFSLAILFAVCFTLMNFTVVLSEPAVTQDMSAVQQSVALQQVKQPQTASDLDNIPDSIPEKNHENLMKIKDYTTTSKIFKTISVGLFFIFISVLIFIGYKLYKKWNEKGFIIEAPSKESLATPTDFKSAINLFLGKTDE